MYVLVLVHPGCTDFYVVLLGKKSFEAIMGGERNHLAQHVTSSLDDLAAFIMRVDAGLAKEVEDGDYDGLVATYEQEMSDQVHTLLEELPDRWTNLKKVAATAKQVVAPLQANEVAIIRKKCSSFDVKQHEFRELFRRTAPLEYNSSNAYARLDRLHVKVAALEREMGALHESASLFEVNTPDYGQLKACRRREVGQLKQLWDVVELVHSSIEEWKTTL
ncbi:dynein beta chain, ciliary-like [Oscarella lobularis]|uniref:dynein beta chain, ciliary-like n=1 Tax=Oscarella lobularis TaxID=121494 RepID=UPI003313DFDC